MKKRKKTEMYAADSEFSQYAQVIERAVAISVGINAQLLVANGSKLTDQERAAATVAGILGYLSAFAAHVKLPTQTTRENIEQAIELWFSTNGDRIDAIARGRHN